MSDSSKKNTYILRRNITNYCNSGRFSEAENIFQDLLYAIDYPALNLAYKNKDQQQVDQILDNLCEAGHKINDFQKSIGTLTRYAPTPELALKYASFCICEMPDPFTDDLLEIVLTINLIFVYGKTRREEYMLGALKLVKKGVELKYHLALESTQNNNLNNHYKNKYKIIRSESFSKPYEIFTTVSHPVLNYFNLKWSSDGRSIEKIY